MDAATDLLPLLRDVREYVAALEWDGVVWTDVQCCLSCGALNDSSFPHEPHREGCAWVAMMRRLDEALGVQSTPPSI